MLRGCEETPKNSGSRRGLSWLRQERKLLYNCFVLLTLLISSSGYAADQSLMFKHFDIDVPALNAAEALNMLAAQTNSVLLFPYKEVSAKRANAVNGSYTLEEAVSILLDGSGLRGSLSDNGAIKISFEEAKHQDTRDTESKMNTTKKSIWSVLGFIAAAGAAQSVVAEAVTDTDRYLEEVVVTAQKRSESVQDVPLAVTALSAAALQARGISSPQDLQFSVPGLTITGTELGQAKVTIRGVGYASEVAIGSDPGVPLHIDGHYTQASSYVTRDMFDVERVEVLRGPQGTLYGRNALGGTINIITKRPSEEFEAMLSAESGNYSRRLLQGVISGPLNASVRGRLAFSTENRDGYITNLSNGDDLNDSDYAMVRGSLGWDVTENIEVLLSAFSYRDDSNGPAAQLAGEYPREPLLLGFLPNPWLVAGVGSNLPDDARTLRSELTPKNSNDADGLSVTVDWDLRGSIFRSLTSYNDTAADFSNVDLDGSDSVFTEATSLVGWETWTQEFQLLSNNDDDLKWVVGAFYYDESSTFKYMLDFFSLGGPGNPNARFVGGPQQVKSTSAAVFGQLDWPILEDLALVAGLRYTRDKKDVTEGIFFATVDDPVVPTFAANSASWSKITGKLGLNYFVGEDMLFYGEVSQGYKAGGFNAGSFQAPYDPESITAYQAGFKSQLFDRVQLNLAAYYYDYEDKQESKIEQLLVLFENAGAATATGLELELHARPTEALTIDVNLTYQKAEYDVFLTEDPIQPALGLQDLNGKYLPYSPQLKAYLGAQYDWQLDLGFVSARLDYAWSDDYFLRAYNLDSDRTDSYHRTNARLSWSSNNDLWDASVFVNNIEDEDVLSYITIAAGTLGNVVNARYFAPRTYGLQVKRHF